MSQIPSVNSSTDTASGARRGRYLAYAAIGCLIALVVVVLPDLLRPEEAQAIEVPNPLEELGDLAGSALGGAADAVSAPLKEGFVWMVNTLFGGPQAEMTMALIRYLTTMPNFASGSVMELQRNMQAVAAALLGCVLTLSILRYALGSVFEGSNIASGLEGVVKVVFAALMIGLWPTLFRLAGTFFNTLSATLMTGPLKDQLRELFTEVSGTALFASGLAGPIGSSLGMLIWIVIAIATTILFLGLLLMKIMVTAGTVIVFIAMPLALILWPIPETSWIAKALAKTLVVLLAIPVVWLLIFSAAAALGADVFGATDKEGAEIASTGLDAILIKPLVAIALMYMAISVPSKLLKMAPMMGALRGGGRVSGAAMGIGTSMAARGAFNSMAGGAGAAGGRGAKGAAGSSTVRPNVKTDAGARPTYVPAVGGAPTSGTPAAASGVSSVAAAPANKEAVDAATGHEAGRQAKAMAAASFDSASAPPKAWNASAVDTYGQGKYGLPGEASSSALQQRNEQAGKLKQQWAENETAGRTPSSAEARQAFESLSPQAQAGIQRVAADTGMSGGHRDHMAGPAVNENPYHGDEARQAFSTLGASTPAVFQEAVNSKADPAPTSSGDPVTSVVVPTQNEAAAQVFESSTPSGKSPAPPGSGGGGGGGGTRPSPPAPTARAPRPAPQNKQGG